MDTDQQAAASEQGATTDAPVESGDAQKKVVIYSTPTCHFCHMAKEFFDENGVAYTDYNVAEDQEKLQEMMNKTGQRGVPQIDIDGDIVIGFNEEKIRELLGL